MKNIVSLFLAVSVFSTITRAQSSIQTGFMVLPQFTNLLNAQDRDADNALNYSTTTGFAGGITGAYNFNNFVGVEVNLIYSQQGQSYTGDLNNYDGNNTADNLSYLNFIFLQENLININNLPINGYFNASVSLSYFKIPFMFRFTSNTKKPAFLYLTAGPEFNILLSATETLDQNTINYNSTWPLMFNFTTKQLFESTGVDAVINLGGGFNLNQNLTVTTQLDIDYGLTDAENKNFQYSVTDETSLGQAPTPAEVYAYPSGRAPNHNLTIGLRVGIAYTFNLGKSSTH